MTEHTEHYSILLAEHDHIMWIHQLISAIETNNTCLFPELSNKECDFGKWLYDVGVPTYGNKLSSVVQIHSLIHKRAEDICNAVLNDKSKAGICVDELRMLSEELLQQLKDFHIKEMMNDAAIMEVLATTDSKQLSLMFE